MDSVLKNDNFDNLSDDLFSDGEAEDFNTTFLSDGMDTQESEPSSYEERRYAEKKRLFEIYMADPSIPPGQRNGRCFLMNLHQPLYRSQKIREFKNNLCKEQNKRPSAIIQPPKRNPQHNVIGDFGYDNTFFATKEEILEQRRRIEEIPKPIKEIYQEKGIVTASQIYKIEKKLNCDSDESDSETNHGTSNQQNNNKELSKSLMELSQTLTEQHEISQIMKEIENLNDLDLSLSDLTEKLQYSSRAKNIIDYTITCSQNLKILEEINTCKFDINTCDVLGDYEMDSHSQEVPLNNLGDNVVPANRDDKILPIENGKNSDVNGNIPNSVKFSFASGKNIPFKDSSVIKFKNIFQNEERKTNSPDSAQNPNKDLEIVSEFGQYSGFQGASKLVNKNLGEKDTIAKHVGFSFASGKNVTISNESVMKFKNIFGKEEESLERQEADKENSIVVDDIVEKISEPEISTQELLWQELQLLNAYDIFSDEDDVEPDKDLQNKLEDKISQKEPAQKAEISLMENDKRTETSKNIPSNVMFSFASGKNISFKNSSIAKFKNIFENEDKNSSSDENPSNSAKNSSNKNAVTGEIPKQVGFSFASGKNITFKDSSISKFKNIFENEEKNSSSVENPSNSAQNSSNSAKNSSNKNAVTGEIPKQVGFSFASGKNITFKDSSISKFKNIFENEEKNSSSDENPSNSAKNSSNSAKNSSNKNAVTGEIPKQVGFSFASGKNITFKDSSISKFKNIFENEEKNSSSDENPSNSAKNPSNSVENPSISAKNPSNSSKVSSNKNAVTEEIPKHVGFSFASGKNIAISNGKVAKFKNIFENEEKNSERTGNSKENLSHNKNVSNNDERRLKILQEKNNRSMNQGSAIEKKKSTNQNRLNSVKRKLEDDLEENEQPNETVDSDEKTTSSNQSSLKSRKDSGLNLNSYRRKSVRTKSGLDDDSDVFNFSSLVSQRSQRGKRNSQILTPECSTNGNKIMDSGIESQNKQHNNNNNKIESPPKSAFSSIRAAFFAPSFTSSPVVAKPKKIQRISESENSNKKENPMSSIAALRKTFNIKEKNTSNKRNYKSIDTDEDEEIIPFKPFAAKKLALEKNEHMISPIVKPSSRKTRNFCIIDRMTLSQRLNEFDAFMEIQSQKRLYGNDPTASQFNSILEIEQEHISRIEAENRVKMERREAFKEQMEYVDAKPEEDSRQMTGTMFMMKSGRNRTKLKDYLEGDNPIEKNIHAVDLDQILEFSFDAKNLTVDSNLKVFLIVGDNAKVILDEDSKIGFTEIKYSFLASYGVDPKLIKTQWIENAYKMIFMKFLWMENSFEKIDKFEVLSVENVLLQLKYRYDREIDRHQRPALRKITEMDEAANRRIVLKVINIIYNLDVGYELELSDGWYKIRSCVDSCLAEAISKKKIVANTKLITCNAELINVFSAGNSPLELPPSVRLKIHGNSTRKVSWDTKLGFCKSSNPFLISLDSVSPEGGVIGRLRLFIVHVYSIVYVESNGEKKEFRSEKMQNRLENKKEILYSTMYETIQKQIMNETFKELKERVEKIDKSKLVLSKMSIHEICDILEYESESNLAYAIKSQLSGKQMEKVIEICNQRKYELHQKIKERIIQNENNVAQLLKFRVVDATNPKKTALVSWWRPSEELLNIIKVGNSIELLKTSSAGKFQAMYGGEIQIHADKATVVKLLKAKPSDAEKFKKFIRTETKFEAVTHLFSPLNNEFDIVCMIVHVDEKQNDGKSQQRVYVADEKMNFISLNFYPSLIDYAYDDVLIEGKILYIRNLRWRKLFKDNNTQLPEAHAVIDSTIFISNPRDDEQKRRLNEFEEMIKDSPNHLQMCREKLENLIGYIPDKSKHDDSIVNVSNTSVNNVSRKRVLGMKRYPRKYGFS